jgi:hypothetical protein
MPYKHHASARPANRRVDRPLALVSRAALLTNTAATPLFDAADQARLREFASRDLASLLEVRGANDIHLFDSPNGWELTGVDVASRAFLRRLGPRRRTWARRTPWQSQS